MIKNKALLPNSVSGDKILLADNQALRAAINEVLEAAGYGTILFDTNPVDAETLRIVADDGDATQAYGDFVIGTLPQSGDVVGTDVDGGPDDFSFVTSVTNSFDQILIGADIAETVANFVTAFNDRHDEAFFVASSPSAGVVRITAGTGYVGTAAHASLSLHTTSGGRITLANVGAGGFFENGTDGGTVFTFLNSASAATEVQIGATKEDTAASLLSKVNDFYADTILLATSPTTDRVRLTAGSAYPGSSSVAPFGILQPAASLTIEENFENGTDAAAASEADIMKVEGGSLLLLLNPILPSAATSAGHPIRKVEFDTLQSQVDGLEAATAAAVTDAIVDGVTTVAPSQNAVYDALQLKLSLAGGTMSGDLNLGGNDLTGADKIVIPDTGTVGIQRNDAEFGIWLNGVTKSLEAYTSEGSMSFTSDAGSVSLQAGGTGYVSLGGGLGVNLNAFNIKNVAEPVDAQDASTKNYVDLGLALKINATEKGANNGVSTLDSGGKVPVAQLPNSIMQYKAVWDASTNTPALANGAGNSNEAIGDVYKVSVAGTVDFGAGNITFVVGDYVILNDQKIWELAHAGGDAVNSVNGQAGVVVLDTGDIAEDGNLYHTDARAKAASVLAGAITDGETKAPTHDAVHGALALKADQEDLLLRLLSVNGITPAGTLAENATGTTTGATPILSGTNDTGFAQSFTALTGGTLSEISMGVHRVSAADAGAIFMEVRTMDGGFPSATILATSEPILCNTLTEAVSVTALFQFLTPIALSEGVQYAMVVRRDATARTAEVSISSVYSSANPYAGGNGFTSSDLSLWNNLATIDAVFTVTAVATGAVVIGTDDIAEGSTNLYHTTARALAAAVQAGAITDSVTKAPTHDAVFDALAANLTAANLYTDNAVAAATPTVDGVTVKLNGSGQLEGLKPKKQKITLVAGDITNGYVDLAFLASVDSVNASYGSALGYQGAAVDEHYTLSTVGAVTRVTFSGIWASGPNALAADDNLYFQYMYL